MYNILDSICLVQMMYNILDNICLVQMSVQYTWQYMFSSNECTIYLTYILVWVQMSVYKYVQYTWYMFRHILDSICLVQMSVQYAWQYMFSSNECTIYLTVYV